MRQYFLPIVCVAALAACGRNRDEQHGVTINGNGGSVTVAGNGEHVTFHDAAGKQSVDIDSNGGAAPANLPDYAAVYPGAKITASVAGSGNNGKGGMIVEQTSASLGDVVAFYKKKSSNAGFVESMNMTMGGSMMFSSTSPDKKKTLAVVASTSNGATQAQITWGSN